MDVYHFAYRGALLARGSFKIGGNTVRFSASLIHNHFASRLATTLSSAVAASCSSLHISDEVAQVVSSSETCRHPAGAPQLLGLVTIEHLWRFMISKSALHNVHLMPQEHSPPTTSNKQGPSAEFSMALCMCGSSLQK